jgi:hypothetical protein
MMATQRDNRSDLSPRKVADKLKEEGKQRLERGKTTAADQVDHVANALKSAGNELGTESPLATYANSLADSISRFGNRLREGSIEDLASDMQLAARRNPTLFVAGGLALGIVLARLVKAASPEESEPLLVGSDYDELSTGTSTTGVTSGEAYRSSGAASPDAPTVDVSGGEYGSTGSSSTRPYGG